ncbi:hypothetical protein CMI37_03820 [Candidatus Pacearchaeota archaeon]|nr:hypothetical protein [Candidatus Pacearchaeota archaeon]
MTTNEPIAVDNSILNAVASCSTEAVLRYVYHYTTLDEAATLRSGSAGHDAMAVWLRGGTKDAALDAFTAAYYDWSAANNIPRDDRLAFNNIYTILDYWFDKNPVADLPYRVAPDLIEVGFAYPLDPDGEFTFCGRMDAIVGDITSSSIYPLDHKFTGNLTPYFKKRFRNDSQMSGYVWGAQQSTSRLIPGVYINAIELRRLPSDPVRRCRTHGTSYAECGYLHATYELIGPITRSDAEIDEWRRTAIHLARRFRDLLRRFPTLDDLWRVRTQGKFHGSCAFCHFNDFCAVGRPMNLVDSMLRRERWEPFTYAFKGRADADATVDTPTPATPSPTP